MRQGILVLVMLWCAATAAYAQEAEQRNDVAWTLSGAKMENSQDWWLGFNLGVAYDAFRKPQLPLMLEYTGLYRLSEFGSDTSLHYGGVGIRLGGRDGFYGLITGGFAHATSTLGSATKAGLNVAGGVNVPMRDPWGIRVEARGVKVQDLQPWFYQFGGGIYVKW